MNIKKCLFYCLTILLGGCLPVLSLNPIYTEEDVIFEEYLLGTWVGNESMSSASWEFTRAPASEEEDDDKDKIPAYITTFKDEEGKQVVFKAHLIKLKDQLFMDFYPHPAPWDVEPNEVKNLYNTLFMLPVHSFAKIKLSDNKLTIILTDEDSFGDLMSKIKEDEDEQPNYMIIENRTLLIDSPKLLQKFILKYSDDEQLFTDEIKLKKD
jgi:hypothetical protein